MKFKLFKKKYKPENKVNPESVRREMCLRAVEAGVCPRACEICAWGIFHK